MQCSFSFQILLRFAEIFFNALGSGDPLFSINDENTYSNLKSFILLGHALLCSSICLKLFASPLRARFLLFGHFKDETQILATHFVPPWLKPDDLFNATATARWHLSQSISIFYYTSDFAFIILGSFKSFRAVKNFRLILSSSIEIVVLAGENEVLGKITASTLWGLRHQMLLSGC